MFFFVKREKGSESRKEAKEFFIIYDTVFRFDIDFFHFLEYNKKRRKSKDRKAFTLQCKEVLR